MAFFSSFRESSRSSGQKGEELAAREYRRLGYRLEASNFRMSGGEIDLILRKGDTLVFAEVKARSGDRYGSPLEAITPRKQSTIARVALAYLAAGNLDGLKIRFDAVAVYLDEEPPRVEIVEAAFEVLS